LLLAAGSAGAAELRVVVSDQHGKPVADAVVSAVPAPGEPVPAPPPPRSHTINQVALTFVPYIEVFRTGDKVLFHNSDRTRHHVYSFSSAKAFEFMLSPGEGSPPLVLDRPGVVAVGCNIHDQMITYLYVSDAPWVGRSGADGMVRLSGLPAGRYTVRAWQPRLRPGRAEAVQEGVVIGAGGAPPLAFKLALLPDMRQQHDLERAQY
jgi:hypothetical protein